MCRLLYWKILHHYRNIIFLISHSEWSEGFLGFQIMSIFFFFLSTLFWIVITYNAPKNLSSNSIDHKSQVYNNLKKSLNWLWLFSKRSEINFAKNIKKIQIFTRYKSKINPYFIKVLKKINNFCHRYRTLKTPCIFKFISK